MVDQEPILDLDEPALAAITFSQAESSAISSGNRINQEELDIWFRALLFWCLKSNAIAVHLLVDWTAGGLRQLLATVEGSEAVWHELMPMAEPYIHCGLEYARDLAEMSAERAQGELRIKFSGATLAAKCVLESPCDMLIYFSDLRPLRRSLPYPNPPSDGGEERVR